MDNDKNILNDQKHIPWYFGRKFWGIMIALSALPGIGLIFITEYPKIKIIKGILGYLGNLGQGFIFLMLYKLNLKINTDSRIILYYIILYYIILIIPFFFLTFRKKKVNIVFPILIIIIIIISTIGMLASSIGV